MCKECLIEVRPDVGTFTTDTGTNMLNFKSCAQCHKYGFLKEVTVSREIEGDSDDDEDCQYYSEDLRYQHVCSFCGHIVAEHLYLYIQDEETQDYNMDCFLCGKGGSTISFDVLFEDLVEAKHNDPTTSGPSTSTVNLGAVIPNPDDKLAKRLAVANQAVDKMDDNDDGDWD